MSVIGTFLIFVYLNCLSVYPKLKFYIRFSVRNVFKAFYFILLNEI